MKKDNKQARGNTNKKDINAGSGGFNQGSKQDPRYNEGTKVGDEEKKLVTPLHLERLKKNRKMETSERTMQEARNKIVLMF